VTADRSQHLLWRLTTGRELPATLQPDVVVVLIGTNNIADDTVESIALGIKYNIDVIHKALPNATILVNEIFPRYDTAVLKKHKETSTVELNALLQDLYADHKSASNVEGIRYVHCGALFAPTPQQHALDSSTLVNIDLMPDKLHPNALGMKKWLTECILPPALKAME
jgi:lysophospholipase L1-like esterase